MKLLVVEDDLQLGRSLAAALSQAAFLPTLVHLKGDAETHLKVDSFAAVVLDLGLPDGSGLDLLAWMRRVKDATPVLVLTARDGVDERVQGLDAGADDYLPKPFAISELLSRLRALIRRSGGHASREWAVGEVSLLPEAREVRVGGVQVPLSKSEFRVLQELMRRPNAVVTRDRLEEAVAGDGEPVESNALEVYIHHLRRKLGSDFIKTVRGVGYKVVR